MNCILWVLLGLIVISSFLEEKSLICNQATRDAIFTLVVVLALPWFGLVVTYYVA